MNAHERELVRQARELIDKDTGIDDRRLLRFVDEAPGVLGGLADAVERLQKERDLAIAHDRQPYPTAEAYEQACAALERKQTRIADLEDGMRDLAEQLERGGLRRTAMRLRVVLEDDEGEQR